MLPQHRRGWAPQQVDPQGRQQELDVSVESPQTQSLLSYLIIFFFTTKKVFISSVSCPVRWGPMLDISQPTWCAWATAGKGGPHCLRARVGEAPRLLFFYFSWDLVSFISGIVFFYSVCIVLLLCF